MSATLRLSGQMTTEPSSGHGSEGRALASPPRWPYVGVAGGEGSLEVLGLVVLYFLGFFFVGGFFFVRSTNRRGEHLTRTWSSYAAERRYEFAPGTAPEWPFHITGSRDALDFRLEVDARNALVTRLVARPTTSAVGRVVATRGRVRRGETMGKRRTGDAHFDSLFDVYASDAHAAEMGLRPAVRMALQRFPMRMVGAGLRLALDGDEAIVEWTGGEVEPAELDAAHANLREVCGIGEVG